METIAETKSMTVEYEVNDTSIILDRDFVRKYLVRGNPQGITDQEIMLFMQTCKSQRLNPLVSNEVYLQKVGTFPAQMVIGKAAYLRRAFENPEFICKEDGIVVLRSNGEIVAKEGVCVYPTEQLIGGWCRIHYVRFGKERTTYREVSFGEYNKGQSAWKTMPATMINKVAISQAIREAFPKDYEGLYSEEEMIASGAIQPNFSELKTANEMPYNANIPTYQQYQKERVVTQTRNVISKDQRIAMFSKAKEVYSPENAQEQLKSLISAEGFNNTQDVTVEAYERIMSRMSNPDVEDGDMETQKEDIIVNDENDEHGESV